MTTSTPTPQEEAYIWRIGRALRCGNLDCGCAPSPTDRLHCPVHSHPYVPTLSVRYEPGFGFTFTCSSGCPSEKINDALSRRGLPLESALLTATGASELGLHPYELLIPQPTDWLWPNRIPMGEFTVVAGHPASGKTAVALDVATRVSLGADTPDQPGTKFVRAPVVIAAPLKNPRASLLPRLRSLGADLNLIYHADLLSPMHLADFPEEADVESLEDVTRDASAGGVPHFFDPFAPPPPPPERPELPPEPSLRFVMNRLASLIARGRAALLVVDQIEHLALIHNARVSHVAGMLNSLAARTGAAVLALAHNPAHTLEAAARYMQPRLGMAGTVFTIALVGEDRARFLVPLSPPMHDALHPIPFNFHDAPPIAWREPIPQERLLALNASKASRPQRTDMTACASRFLTGALAHGPKPAAELTKRARDLGISRHHLSRARIACNVTTARFNPAGSPPGSGHWLWSLAQHTTPPPALFLDSGTRNKAVAFRIKNPRSQTALRTTSVRLQKDMQKNERKKKRMDVDRNTRAGTCRVRHDSRHPAPSFPSPPWERARARVLRGEGDGSVGLPRQGRPDTSRLTERPPLLSIVSMAEPGPSRALFADLYELTMAQAYWQHGHNASATFSLAFRNLPPDRGYAVFAGLEDALDHFEALRFTDADVDYLRSLGLFDAAFLDWLPSLRFTGDMRAMGEGELVFPEEPVIEVTAPIIEAQLVETAVMNAIGLQTMLATKAARVWYAAQGRGVVEFAARRTQGEEAADRLARVSYMVGFAGTSNVRAASRYGIPPVGTMAHSFISSFPTEAEAYDAYADSFPDTSTLLVDTYDTVEGVRRAAEAGKRLRNAGHTLRAIRLDSGDLLALSLASRRILDDAGLPDVQVLASGGLDEFDVEALLAAGAPIDGFGVGTRLGVSADAPWMDWAYKLAEYDGTPVLKLSEGKASLAGRKQVYRRTGSDGTYAGDLLALADERLPDGDGAPLLAPAVQGGRRIVPALPLAELRERFAANFARLPARYKALRSPELYPVQHTWALEEEQWGATQNTLARQQR